MLAFGAGFFWTHRSVDSNSIVDDFWGPLTRDQRSVILCTGSVVFAQDKYSGVITAGTNGNVDYPFVIHPGPLRRSRKLTRLSSARERIRR
ncbi:MAG: hypothetical protein WDM87_10695 [Terracidiphilus sp.]